MSRTTRSAAFGAVLAVACMLAGCSVGDPVTVASTSVAVGGSRIKASEIEKKAVAEFADKVPKGATVKCPDMTGEKGATARCTWTFGDRSTLGMTVTVTSFTKSTGRFRVSFANDAKVTPAP